MSNPFLDPPPKTASSASPSSCPLCDGQEFSTLFRKQAYDFVRCRACALVRLDPIPDARSLARVYEESYQEGAYAVFAAADEIRRAHARARVRIVSPHAPDGPWLDVGCSTGALLDAASSEGIDIDGFDISEVAVRAARDRGLSAFHAAVEDFEPPRRYAYITAFDVLEHVIDPGDFLERARGWLQPGGRIALTVPDIKSVHARLMRRYWYYYAAPLHITYFDRRTVTRMLEKHQLWPISIASAPKVMTISYIESQLATFNPVLGRTVRALTRFLPGPIRERELPIPTGEILVVASA